MLVAVLLCTQFLCSCSRDTQSHQFFVFGTMVDIKLVADNQQLEQQVVTEIHQQFRDMHRDLHAWKPGPLVRLNRCLASGQWCEVAPDTAQLIMESTVWTERSNGLFDPGIGALVSLWGFHTDDYPITDPPPNRNSVDALVRSQPSVLHLRWNAQGQVRSTNTTTQLDFGGFAKGVAVDKAVEIAAEAGVTDLIANAGGDLRAVGSDHGRPWRIAIRRAFGDGHLGGILTDGDDAIFTSGVYQRYGEFDGERYAHIIDPSTGQPVSELLSATVIADSGAAADAAATALVVAGPGGWRDIARQLAIDEALVVTGDGKVYATAAMAGRLVDIPDDVTIMVVE